MDVVPGAPSLDEAFKFDHCAFFVLNVLAYKLDFTGTGV